MLITTLCYENINMKDKKDIEMEKRKIHRKLGYKQTGDMINVISRLGNKDM